MTAVLAHTSDTAIRLGWDLVDRRMLGELRRDPTMTELIAWAGLPVPIVRDVLLGYEECRLVVRVVDAGVRYQLTLAGRKRLAALTTNIHTSRKAA